MPVIPVFNSTVRPRSHANVQEVVDLNMDSKGPKNRYVLNIRGQRFEIEKSLCRPSFAPDTRLASLDDQNEAYCHESGEYFFNRDPLLFNCILSFYVTGERGG